jgi:iron only hydrogenase large subunit-like protein
LTVLTTREISRVIKQAGIDFLFLPDGTMDAAARGMIGATP